MNNRFDVHKNAMENLQAMGRDALWKTLLSFEGTSNIINADDHNELLLEAQAQVERAYRGLKPNGTKSYYKR